jgi:hypothetical protein
VSYDSISDEDYEREAFCVLSLRSLPKTGVDLVEWPGVDVDWMSAAKLAVRIFNAGVDPLDEVEIRLRVLGSSLRRRDRSWAVDLFIDPIALYAKSRRWSGGRHRVEAMRRVGVSATVLKILT